MSTAATTSPSPTNVVSENGFIFNAYPAFAKYIRENHLVEYITEQIELSFKLNLPMLVHIKHLSKEQLLEIGLPAHTDFLLAVENNRLKERLEKALKTWENDEIGIMRRDDLSTEDITLASYIRKQAQFKFLPLYTGDINLAMTIVSEIEAYETESLTASTNTYINIFRQRSNQHAYFIERIANTTPGSLYVFDLQKEEIIYSNNFTEMASNNGELHPEDALLIKADQIAFANADDGEIRTIEFRTRQNNGEYKWYRGYRSIFKRDAQGVPSQIIGITIDIDDQIRKAEELEKGQMQLNDAQIQASVGSFEWDVDNNIFTASPNYLKMFGFDKGVTQKDIQDGLHPDDLEKIIAARTKAIEELGSFDIEYRYQRNGEEKVFWSRGKASVKDGNRILSASVMDITNRHLLLNRLRDNQEFIQKIANTTPSLITSFNANTGKFTYINSAAETLLGYTVDSFMEKGFEYYVSLIHPDDVDAIMAKHYNAVEEINSHLPENDNEVVVEFKYRIRHADGSYKWFNTYGTIFDRNKEGKIEHILNVSVDVTEQMEAEEELNYRNFELQQSNASLGEYAYVASHDLKEPLRKIATFGDLLQTTQRELLTDSGKMYLDKIVRSAVRMQDMINDLLTVSTISGNKSFEDTDLNIIVDEVLQTLEYKIELKKAKITVDKLPHASIVPSQFAQLLQNLLSNSLKFANEVDQPRISITHKYIRPSEVPAEGLTPANMYLRIQVADNGIGFEKEFAHKIFTIFQRLHGKSEYEGTGIGLAICKKIAENHGGTIYADSDPGKGSVFTIIIPV